MQLSRVYADAASKEPPEYTDYTNLTIQYGNPNRYELIKSVGRGQFSEVFKAYDKQTNEYVSIKHLRPVRLDKTKREIKIMQLLKDGPNILPLLDILQDTETGYPMIVTKWVDSIHYRDFYKSLSDHDFRYFLYKMLIGIDYAHSRGIMHRDIKPQNILVDYKTRDVYIIDWGLADFYLPDHSFNCRVSTRSYKGPELLTNNKHYDYSVDMWAFGCMIAGIVFNRLPFFRAHGNVNQLLSITDVLGSEGLHNYVKKYNLTIPQEAEEQLGVRRQRDWSEYASDGIRKFICTELFDLLDNLLIYDHQKRLTAKECMKHPYFDMVREEVETETAKMHSKKMRDERALLSIMRSMRQQLQERAESYIDSSQFHDASAICEQLETLSQYIQSLEGNHSQEIVEEARRFVESVDLS